MQGFINQVWDYCLTAVMATELLVLAEVVTLSFVWSGYKNTYAFYYLIMSSIKLQFKWCNF